MMATSSVGKPIVLDGTSAKRFHKAMKTSPSKLVVQKRAIQKVHSIKHGNNRQVVAVVRAEIYPLYNLVSSVGETKVRKTLNRFVCERDDDVALFLKEFAIERELSHDIRTYAVVDKDNDELSIVAFFAIGIAVVEEKDHDDDGSFGDKQIPVFLLSQIARDDRYGHDDLDGTELLDNAEELIRRASDLVGGRAIFLDCKEDLLPYYQDRGYSFVMHDEETGLYRLAKPVYGNN